MKKKNIFIATILVHFLFSIIHAGIIVNIDKYAIYAEEDAPYVVQFSTQELQKHLSLIFSVKPPVIHDKKQIDNYEYIFYVGIKDPADNKELATEECRYSIYENKTYIYGDDAKGINTLDDVLSVNRYYTGTLNGIYLFLENEFGVDWIAPEDAGIVYPKMQKLTLTSKNIAWRPPLSYRDMWQTAFSDKGLRRSNAIPDKFGYINKNYIKKQRDKESLFFRRLKLGSRKKVGSTHAYTDYWKKYKDIHPNWFALNKNGERKPLGDPKYMKMCLTADGLVDHLVDEWHDKWLENSDNLFIFASENDGDEGFCRCEKCKALDIELPEDQLLKWDQRSKSDRYIWFWNQISQKAFHYTPNVFVTVYIYSKYRFAPRKQMVTPGILAGFVPRFFDDPEMVKETLDGWCKMGLKNMFIRPNDFNDDIGMPTGNEQYIFERFNNSWVTAQKYGANVFGVSYDRNYSYNDYEVNGLAFYTIAKAVNYPEQSFNEITHKYYQAYGNAENLIKSFFEYWRNNFYKRRYPNRDKAIGYEGRNESFAHISNYYKKEDFEKSKDILLEALNIPNLQEQYKMRINKLLWDLECKYAEFKAIYTSNNLSNITNLVDAVDEMMDLRYKYRNLIFSAWHRAFKVEDNFGDVTGLKRIVLFGNLSFIKLPTKLRFAIDPHDVGVSEKWFTLSAKEVGRRWSNFIDITHTWETGKGELSTELRDSLKKYDGIAWYYLKLDKSKLHYGKEHYLLFGAVDESCWVYVNGKLAGKRLYANDNDWQTPFKIRIDQNFIENEDADIFIRVEDKAGAGGIWKNITLGIEQ